MGLGDIIITVYDIVVLHINVENLQAHAFPYSELHQNGLSNAGQDVNSCEEEDMQVELHPAGGAPSRESVHTAVSERSYQ